MNIVYIYYVLPVAAAPIPREEAVTRPAGQPANASKSAAESETQVNSPPTSTKAKEGNIRRRPKRLIPRIDRPWPPAPIPAVNEPASIMIGRRSEEHTSE